MNAKHTLLVSLLALATAALAGCSGSHHAKAPGGGGYDAPAAAAADADYEAAGAYPDGPATASQAPSPGYGQSSGAPAAEMRSKSSASDSMEMAPAEPQTRPGLATTFGERRHSQVTTAPFVRADRMSPFATAQVYYNDPQGIAAMSDTLGGVRHHNRRFAVGGGHVEIGLRDGSGRFLTGFSAGGHDYVTGLGGDRYTIYLKNHSPGRIEVVVSVDGLDVIDGKSASFSKRGYLLDPYGDLTIDGFRTSNSEVAAFRFGSVRDSYAARKHGDTRNVGVIGVALFNERGDSPRFWGTPRSHGDVVRRHDANPFPSQYATPPN